jgi:hypothetical protein
MHNLKLTVPHERMTSNVLTASKCANGATYTSMGRSPMYRKPNIKGLKARPIQTPDNPQISHRR